LNYSRLNLRGLGSVIEILNRHRVLNFDKVSTKGGITQTHDVRMFAAVQYPDLVVEAL
jgi:hypothetical protein